MGGGIGRGLDFGNTWGSGRLPISELEPDAVPEDDWYIGRSLGAAAIDYDVKDSHGRRRALLSRDQRRRACRLGGSALPRARAHMRRWGRSLLVKGEPKEFNTFHFGSFVDFHNMKGNDAYSYNLSLGGEQPSWGYSQQAIDLMLQEIRRDPEHVIDSMCTELSRRKSREKKGR